MAIFHFNAKVLTRSNGDNAVAASAYRAGDRFICERTGMIFNYTRKSEVQYREIRAPAHAAPWTFNRSCLWNQVEKAESRKNSQLAREIEVALPIELSLDQQIHLLRGFVDEQFVAQGMVADVCLHAKLGNPHAHILLTLRSLNQTGFGDKRREWNSSSHVETWRAAWAGDCNYALTATGLSVKVDHRSLADQGIARIPTVHEGRSTNRTALQYATRRSSNNYVEAKNELSRIAAQIRDVRRKINLVLARITTVKNIIQRAMAPALARHRVSNGFIAAGDPNAAASIHSINTRIHTAAGKRDQNISAENLTI